ncbi:hypothetical protein AVM11_12045 [Sphingomonas melonis TY]|uniref:Beta-lactamase-related domain-containing protein n=1 Tax=Sphingomonas melonis TY TaxID=621456 RepID=A0A175XZ15_9SPHN|nr:serine hydrolase domain-containing protein [Sphingomonas melonis]KZB93591.1 hypothetical protein AVM11_12045 [Sphingomonas melonis TY]
MTTVADRHLAAGLTARVAALLDEHRDPVALPELIVAFLKADMGDGRAAAPRAATSRPGRIGCVAKLLTSMTMLSLVDDGLLGLDTQAADVVTCPVLARHLRVGRISIRHLLSQSTALDDEAALNGQSRAGSGTLLERLALAPYLYTPGRLFSNERAGSIIAGHLIAEIAGKPILQSLTERVLDPLGAVLHVEERNGIVPAAYAEQSDGFDACGSDRLLMSADDLLRVIASLLKGLPGDRAILSDGLREEVLRCQAPAIPDTFITGFGLGLYLYQNGLAGISGAVGAENCHIGLNASRGAALAFQSRGASPTAFSWGGIYSDLLLLVAGDLPYRDMETEPVSGAAAAGVVGTYRRSRSALSIHATGRADAPLRLEAQFGEGSYLHGGGGGTQLIEADLVPVGPSRYIIDSAKSSAPAGTTKFAELSFHSGEGSAELVAAGGVVFSRIA